MRRNTTARGGGPAGGNRAARRHRALRTGDTEAGTPGPGRAAGDLEKQLREGGHEVSAVLESLPENASEEEWQGSLERMHNRIERLGAINLAAIDEFSQQSERKQYLDSQNEDLETALKTLESAIRKIGPRDAQPLQGDLRPGQQQPRRSVPADVWRRLRLSGDDRRDLLNTGITIMAHPPARRTPPSTCCPGGRRP